jgi:hypothetical protein
MNTADGVDDDVLWLQVAVDDALAMEVRNCFAELPADVERSRHRLAPLGLHDLP